jgi:hypothetical protein
MGIIVILGGLMDKMLFYVQIGSRFYLKPLSDHVIQRLKRQGRKIRRNDGFTDMWQEASMMSNRDAAEAVAMSLNGEIQQITQSDWLKSIEKLTGKKII